MRDPYTMSIHTSLYIDLQMSICLFRIINKSATQVKVDLAIEKSQLKRNYSPNLYSQEAEPKVRDTKMS